MTDDHIGQGSEHEPYVNLLRGISNEVHEHAVAEAYRQGEAEGWRDACRYLESDCKEQVRQRARRIEERIHAQYAAGRRRETRQFFLCAAIAGVIVVALLAASYFTKG